MHVLLIASEFSFKYVCYETIAFSCDNSKIQNYLMLPMMEAVQYQSEHVLRFIHFQNCYFGLHTNTPELQGL